MHSIDESLLAFIHLDNRPFGSYGYSAVYTGKASTAVSPLFSFLFDSSLHLFFWRHLQPQRRVIVFAPAHFWRYGLCAAFFATRVSGLQLRRLEKRSGEVRHISRLRLFNAVLDVRAGSPINLAHFWLA